MHMQHSSRRAGLSLTEVLVAMFIMAIGMISLFTLFPLGAMQVGQALRDDRTSQTALQADAYMRTLWRHQVVDVLRQGNHPTEPFFWALDDPNLVSRRRPTAADTPAPPTDAEWVQQFSNFQLPAPTVPANQLPRTVANDFVSPNSLTGDRFVQSLTNPPSTAYTNSYSPGLAFKQPSYPVLVDPLGAIYRSAADQVWVARTASDTASLNTYARYLLARRQLQTVTSTGLALQVAGMTDDVLFEMNGAPPGGVNPMTRQGRYTWAAILQREDNSHRDEANLTILTFDGRSRLPARTAAQNSNPNGLQKFNDELVVVPDVDQAIGDRQITVTVPVRSSDDPVLVRIGGWVMDGTIHPATSRRHAYFYRITGITVLATTATHEEVLLDLEEPLERDLTVGPSPNASQLYFLAGLAEVFKRPMLKPDAQW